MPLGGPRGGIAPGNNVSLSVNIEGGRGGAVGSCAPLPPLVEEDGSPGLEELDALGLEGLAEEEEGRGMGGSKVRRSSNVVLRLSRRFCSAALCDVLRITGEPEPEPEVGLKEGEVRPELRFPAV